MDRGTDAHILEVTGLVSAVRHLAAVMAAGLPEEELIWIFETALAKAYEVHVRRPELGAPVAMYCGFIVAVSAWLEGARGREFFNAWGEEHEC